MKIGIIGGGNVAHNLGNLIQSAGHEALSGLREQSKVKPGAAYKTTNLADAARDGEAIILAIPYLACSEVLPRLAGFLRDKIVIDATNPLNESWGPIELGENKSAAEEIARHLPGARIVKAFNMVFADIMTS